MNRRAKVSTAVVAACLVAASSASAQNIQVTATVFQAITVTGLQNLDFQNVFPGVNKTVAPTAGSSGRWSVTGQLNAPVNMTFSLPASLSDGGTATLPINSWTGCWEGVSAPTGSCSSFTPSASASNATFPAGGQFWVFIGATVQPAANQTAGNYSGTATLTVVYF